MLVERHPINGSIVVSDIIGQRRVERVYYGYTKRECAQMFRQEVKRGDQKNHHRQNR